MMKSLRHPARVYVTVEVRLVMGQRVYPCLWVFMLLTIGTYAQLYDLIMALMGLLLRQMMQFSFAFR